MDSLFLDGQEFTPADRTLSDLSEVVYDHEWLKELQEDDPVKVLYYMYRDVCFRKDREVLLENKLRYDLTVIPPLNMGCEFVKTLGHYHPPVPHTAVSYPELYQVLGGEAHYLLQNWVNGEVTDVIVVKALTGDMVLIPPGYGHVAINSGGSELQMINWVSREFESDYSVFRQKHGAAYFMLADNSFTANGVYENLPKIRFLKPAKIRELGLISGKSMYSLIKNPRQLEFINKPQDFDWLFKLVLG